MFMTSKPVVASHTRGLSCVCTLTELIFGNPGCVHKLTVRSFTVQISDLLPPPAPTITYSLPSIPCCCAASRRRSWSCSSRLVHPSMPPLRVSGAGLQHRPPLSSTLRTFIHTERGSYLQKHTHTSKHIHTHWAKPVYVCACLLKHHRGARKHTSCTHLQPPYVHLCVCFASGTTHTHTSVYCK